MSPAIEVGAASVLGIRAHEIRGFYGEHWGRPVALTRSEFYDWQFVSHPGAPGHDDTCVALMGDRIVGVMGLTARTATVDGLPRRAVEGTTWVVDRAARGSGVGRAMLDSIQQQFEVFVGASITDDALRSYLPAGFHFLRFVPRFFRVYSEELPESAARVDRLGLRLARLRGAPNTARFSSTRVTDPSTLDGELLTGPSGGGPVNGLARDAAYLRWRYFEHPAFTYAAHLVSGDRGDALVVTRTDEVDGFRFCHVVDVLGAAEALDSALAFVDAFSLEAGVAVADFTTTNSTVCGSLRAAGWFSSVDEQCLQLTHLFHPIELRSPQTTSLSLWAREDVANLLDIGRLHLTKGDLDLDRPTAAYLDRGGASPR